jgi:hypothetical protein
LNEFANLLGGACCNDQVAGLARSQNATDPTSETKSRWISPPAEVDMAACIADKNRDSVSAASAKLPKNRAMAGTQIVYLTPAK